MGWYFTRAAGQDRPMEITVEESLKRVESRAAVLRYLANLASQSPEHPDPSVLSGMGDVAEDIEETVRAIRRGLDIEALCTDVELR